MEKTKTIWLYPKPTYGRSPASPPPPPPPPPAKLRQPPNNSVKMFHDLPFDIQINIISRLPVKLIFACKSLSKDFNEVISNPCFSHIYRINNNSSSNTMFINSNSLSTFSTYEPNQDITLDLVEFERDVYNNDTPRINKNTCFTSGRLHIEDQVITITNSNSFSFSYGRHQIKYSSIWGYCNGLFVILKRELGLVHLFIANPILSGEFIQLPKPVVDCDGKSMAYGLGYCQLTNRYKVLRIITSYLGGNDYENKSEILSIGLDKDWRSVLDDNKVPYNIKPRAFVGTNPQSYMVAYRSALHWFVQPVLIRSNWVRPKWGGDRYICAFDMTDEKVSALPFPPKQGKEPEEGYGMGVLMDKLCLWELWRFTDVIHIWIMDEYGVEGSWSKRFLLKCAQLPGFVKSRLSVLAISVDEGVMLISDLKDLVFYDIKTNNILMLIHLTNKLSHPIPFVPNFMSFRNRKDWIVDY